MRRALIAGFVGALALCAPAQAALPRGFVGLYGDEDLPTVARVGVETVRQPLDWSRVERSPGRFDFSAYDPFVARAARAGVSVLPVLMGPPPFRSSQPAHSRSHAMFPPRSNAAFAAFVSASVRRYGPGGSLWREHPELPFVPIRAWQVWNEPNIPNFWRSGPDARSYVALLRAAASAIRAADPGAEVVAAGLPNSQLGVPFLAFLEQMYRAGAKGSFDTLAIHPYSRNVEGLMALAESARRVMNRHGDRSRLWITEFGWSTGGGASAFRVGERGQADRIAASLSALVAERRLLRLRGFVFFRWKDAAAPPELEGDPWPLHTGLLDAGGSPKRGFWAFALAVEALNRDASSWQGGSAAPVRVSGRTVRLSPLGLAAVGLGCGSDEPGACAGMLRLGTARGLRCGGESARPGAQIGSARFRVAVAPALVPVRLTGWARRLARCAGRVRVRASVADQSVDFVLRAR